MKFLINMVNHESKLSWFENNWSQLSRYLKTHNLHGVEMIFYHDYNIETIPEGLVQGIHLVYWPTWLDFWRQDKKKLREQFLSEENISSFYGGLDREIMIHSYKKEFEIAQSLKTDYMVFHVSHVEVEHTYTWDFTYTDEEVLEAAVEMINEIYGKVDKGVTLLFENLWWPGLNFLDSHLTQSFFERINYPNKGFVLDIGHLMITDKYLTTMDQACDYINQVLDNNPFLIENIVTIHLNKSLTGSYLREDHKEKRRQTSISKDFWENLTNARIHISNIDTHIPFDHKGIKEIIKKANPEYVVYEVLPKDLEELTTMIKVQNEVLDR